MLRSVTSGGVLSSLRAVLRRRQTRRVLAGLDRFQLADVGLAEAGRRRPGKPHAPTQAWLDSLR